MFRHILDACAAPAAADDDGLADEYDEYSAASRRAQGRGDFHSAVEAKEALMRCTERLAADWLPDIYLEQFQGGDEDYWAQWCVPRATSIFRRAQFNVLHRGFSRAFLRVMTK